MPDNLLNGKPPEIPDRFPWVSMQFGYRDSPLEQMAYSLQEGFENDSLPDGVVDLIQQRTDGV